MKSLYYEQDFWSQGGSQQATLTVLRQWHTAENLEQGPHRNAIYY